MRVRINTRVGQIRARFTDDWETGETTYEVTGARVRGVFTVALYQYVYREERLQLDVDYVRIGMGRQNGRRFDAASREDRPVVNGVRLCGEAVVNTSRMRETPLTRHHMSVNRGFREVQAPEATAERTAAVVEGLLTHWLTRPDHHVLRLAATRQAARNCRGTLLEYVRQARETLEEAQEKLQAAEAALAEADAFAAIPPAVVEDATLPEVWTA